MNKQKTLKVLMLTAVFALGMFLPMTTNAQSDGFFRDLNEDYENREGGTTFNINNQTFGQDVPIGSGLLIMAAAGGAYALSRRRKVKKFGAMAMAIVLVLGLTQCKKNVETIATPNNLGEAVHITLHVGDNGGKHYVNTANGEVHFDTGDIIYVGNGGKYIGYLTYGSDSFSGTIYSPSTDDYLHFYYLGGLVMPGDMTIGTTTVINVNIADQHGTLPVLSYTHSAQYYDPNITTYNCTLLNKCALVEFKLTNSATTVTVAGMKTEAAISFANPSTPIAATGTTGAITLHSTIESGTSKWAILLPGAAVNGTRATADFRPYAVDVPAIADNGYLHGTTAVEIDNVLRVFSVDDDKIVEFAPGNLQYKNGTGWRFAEHQYDYIGAWNTSDWVDLFGWGTWGSGKDPLNESTTNSDYQWSTDFQGTLNGHNDWHALISGSWVYLLEFRNNFENLFGLATVAGIHGLIILPDNWELPSGSSFNPSYDSPEPSYDMNIYNVDQWTTMESAGAIFLPAAGCRIGTVVDEVENEGYYWSSEATTDPEWEGFIYDADFNGGGWNSGDNMYAHYGLSVRLVREVQ